jgi:hypothetical protein
LLKAAGRDARMNRYGATGQSAGYAGGWSNRLAKNNMAGANVIGHHGWCAGDFTACADELLRTRCALHLRVAGVFSSLQSWAI